jgi:hypothetical protein
MMLEAKDGGRFEVKSSLKEGKEPISIIASNVNCERKVRVPVELPSIGGHGVAEFSFAVGDDGKFEHPVGGLKIIIE